MDDILIIMLVAVIGMVFFLFMAILGRGEIKLRFIKMMGGFKGRILAKEIRKDGKVYTHRPKIKNNRITLGNRTYDYNIKHTAINKFDLREGYFSEVAGKQINPFDIKTTDVGLSSDTISEMLILATAIAMMPKPSMLNMKNIPWIMLIIGIIIVVAIVSGGGIKI